MANNVILFGDIALSGIFFFALLGIGISAVQRVVLIPTVSLTLFPVSHFRQTVSDSPFSFLMVW